MGAGSVWATTREGGLLWRIEPGRDPVTRTIDVGVGSTFVAFGEGSIWTGNYIDGRVSRVDPRTNAVTAKTATGTPQALAAGAGAAWVSAAGGTTKGALTIPACGERGLRRQEARCPDRLGPPAPGPLSTDPRGDRERDPVRARAARLQGGRARRRLPVLRRVHGARPAGSSSARCAANANAYANAEPLSP